MQKKSRQAIGQWFAGTLSFGYSRSRFFLRLQFFLQSRLLCKNGIDLSLFGEKLYLSPILDLHSSDLVSYTISDRPVLSMVTTMLDKAFEKIPDGTGLILHSD